MSDRFALARRVFTAALVVLAVFGGAYLILKTGHVLLLAFGGVLLAVLLDGLARWVASKTGVRRGYALVGVGVSLLVLLVVLGVLIGPRIVDQASQISTAIQKGQDTLVQTLGQVPWAQPLLRDLSSLQSAAPQILQRVLGVFSTVLGGIANLVIILFIGIYLASNPALYQRGVLHLVDKRHRPRGAEVLRQMGSALRSWLVGRFLSMAVVATMTTVGLLIIGVPLALILGLITFVLEFIPYIGPIVSFALIILVAFVESPQLALYATGLYFVVQFAESYLITPLIQQRVVSLPPALLIFSQILLGTIAGVLGVALAVPLAVAVVVLIQMLYVEDVLGDHTVHVLGADSDDREDTSRDSIDAALADSPAQ